MSKKNAIILILVIFIIIFGGLLWFYFSGNTPQEEPQNIPIESTENPFGNLPSNNPDTQTGTSTDNTAFDQPIAPKIALRQIYSSPTSGAIIFTKGSTTKIRFVDRGTGHVYEARPDSTEIIRLTNNTVPKIQEAVWSNLGDSLIMRYLKDDNASIDSFSAKLKITSSTTNEFGGELTGTFLSPNSKMVAVNLSGNKVFSLINKPENKGSVGIISNLDNSNKNQILDSSISGWLVSWPNDNTITLTTKPLYKNYGYIYFLNSQNGLFNRIFGGISGMTTLTNKTATGILYSESFRGSLRLGYYDVNTNANKNLQIATISDKCVWSNKSKNIVYCAVPKTIINDAYPDSWYQGTVSFADNFWKIDVDKGTTNMIYENNKDLDAIDIKISSDDNTLVFINKKDLSLWQLKLGNSL